MHFRHIYAQFLLYVPTIVEKRKVNRVRFRAFQKCSECFILKQINNLKLLCYIVTVSTDK